MPARIKVEDDDPLTRAIAPPDDETVAQREMRLKKEVEAKKVSDMIDEEINRVKALERRKKPIKILLLGESSTSRSSPSSSATLTFGSVAH